MTQCCMSHPTRPILFLLALLGCSYPFNPRIENELISILVVDGFLNATTNQAEVTLSRAVQIGDKRNGIEELDASVRIEQENGQVVTELDEVAAGIYTNPVMVDPSSKYKLIITTRDGITYESDLTGVSLAPKIDSVSWEENDTRDGINLYTYAHDSIHATHNYKWSATETWRYHAVYPSEIYLKGGVVYPRPPEEQIYICWKTVPWTQITLTSTSALSDDIISHYRLISIPAGSIKLSDKYSVLVQGRSIDDNEYTFWQNLKKTTEQLGGLFDPLPGKVVGNIHRADGNNDPVLGNFSCGTVSEKRIFINSNDLPRELRIPQPNGYCELDTIDTKSITSTPDNVLLIDPFGAPTPAGYLTSTYTCIDCRTKGGTTTKPDFWE